MRILALLGTVLMIGGCATSPEGALVLDWRGSDEGLAMAREAAEEWGAICGRVVVVNRGAGGAPLEEVEGYVEGIPGQNGATWVDDDRTDRMQVSKGGLERIVLAHEMGHALGIVGHASDGLMASRPSQFVHVTPDDCAILGR